MRYRQRSVQKHCRKLTLFTLVLHFTAVQLKFAAVRFDEKLPFYAVVGFVRPIIVSIHSTLYTVTFVCTAQGVH